MNSRPSTSRYRQSIEAWRWYLPYLEGSRGLICRGITWVVIGLLCQAAIPMQVQQLLTQGVFDGARFAVLVLMAAAQLTLGYLANMDITRAGNNASLRLRNHLYQQVLTAHSLQRPGLTRTAVVSRQTSDVDHVSEAFERSLRDGLPAIVRISQSLLLLSWLDWRPGVVMCIAVLGVVAVRQTISMRLFDMDRTRLEANSSVGELVDETISTARLTAGLQLESWMRTRFNERSATLHQRTYALARTVTRFTNSVNIVGTAGLLAVVAFGLLADGPERLTIAAALLYVQAVVQGLESLPAWLRTLHLGFVSRLRIDQLLAPTSAASNPLRDDQSAALTLSTVRTVGRGVFGLVTEPQVPADTVLAELSVDAATDPWRESLEGYRLRREGIAPGVVHVPADAVVFSASIRQHLFAKQPLDSQRLEDVLKLVDLQYLVEGGIDLDEPLGHLGASLTMHERQRLALAMGIASQPHVLLVGPLLPLADADSSLLTSLRSLDATVIMAVQDAGIARSLDGILHYSNGDFVFGSHADLLVQTPGYADLWERRLRADGVDLGVLGIAAEDQDTLRSQLLTEQYGPGEVLYRAGDPADRMLFIMTGNVEVLLQESNGELRRVAVLGAGNHCGDLRLTDDERRGETVRSLDACVVRSLGRKALTTGIFQLLDDEPSEQAVLRNLLRLGPANLEELRIRLPELAEGELRQALEQLQRTRSIADVNGRFMISMRRTARPNAAALFDLIADV